MKAAHTLLWALLLACYSVCAQLPAGFYEEVLFSDLNEVTGIEFDTTGRMYLWEKGGKVFICEDGEMLDDPLIDISEETGNFGDHGLLGFAVHPDFYSNGYFYLYYTVDRHHLLHYGTATYSETINTYFDATICRLTRFTADASTGFSTVVPGSRLVLIGDTKKNGIPILHDSHTGSPLIFGEDKTLLILTGDGASYNEADNGSESDTYYINALADSIITPEENIGSFRSQLPTCLNGKILRIDPETGAGIPSNPFYNSVDPFSTLSRLWALGLRNPFRAELQPGSGNPNPAAADPGTIYFGEVGWNNWEELNICDAPGQNFGWPVFEGMEEQVDYSINSAFNAYAPNPLFNGGSCSDSLFEFIHLVAQETLAEPTFPNPCNEMIQIPASNLLTEHKRPVVDWAHDYAETRIAVFDGVEADWEHIHDLMEAEDFSGAASVGGVWYNGSAYPENYNNTYFHGDFGAGWIKNFHFNADGELDGVSHFYTTPNPVVCMALNPKDGFIYYVQYPSQIKRIVFSDTGNLPPVATISVDSYFGGSPLTVNFSAAGSYDPDSTALTYSWNFGDGPIDTSMNPVHIFTASSTNPQNFKVFLTVTDSSGLSASDSITIFVNNTPPVPDIISITDNQLYTQGTVTTLPLQASVFDLEHPENELVYSWQTVLYHDTHNHPGSPDTNKITTTQISGEGCDGEFYAFKVQLTVTDSMGLSGSDEVWLFPDCSVVPPTALFTASQTNGIAPLSVTFDASYSNNGGDSITSYKWSFGDGSTGNGVIVNKTYATTGTYIVRLIVRDNLNLKDTIYTTITVNALESTEWNSFDIQMLPDSPHAYIPDVQGIGINAYMYFYESADDEGYEFGTPLDVFDEGEHAESYNHAANVWSFDSLFNAYPYVAKSNVSRGTDENETSTPLPYGVFDLQMFPPDNGHNIVAAFIAPATGNYSIKNISARRVSALGIKTRFKVIYDGSVIYSMLPLNNQKWINNPLEYALGQLQQGDEIFFTLNKKDYPFYDGTEIAFTITFEPQVCETPTGLLTTEVTATGATVSWAESGASAYTVVYRKSGSSAGGGMINAGLSTTASLSGLLPCSNYKWQVKATCPAGNVLRSSWTNFSTGGCKFDTGDTAIKTLQIHPNPAGNFLYLVSSEPFVSMVIFDVRGQKVYSLKAEHEHSIEIPVAQLPAGIYTVLVNGSTTAQFTKE